jgi:hypothetical protein
MKRLPKKSDIINLKSKIVNSAKDRKLFIYKQEFYVTIFLVLVILLSITVATMSQEEGPSSREGIESPAYTPTEIRNGEQTITVSIGEGEEEMPKEEIVESSIISFEAEPSSEAPAAVPIESRIKFAIETFQKLATQPLKFNVYDEEGNVITPEYLKTANGQKVHFVMVSADLKEFHNENPVYRDNYWNIPVYMPTIGNYYVYTDIAPVGGRAVTLKRDLTVRQPSPSVDSISYPSPTKDLNVSKDGYTVKMTAEKGAKHGERILTFNIIREGGFALNHRPFKEEFGQLSIFKHGDSSSYSSLYPSKTDSSRAWIKFSPTFVSSGRYTAYATFNLGGNVVSFPFTFDIQL